MDELDDALTQRILDMADARGTTKTLCPSEVARAVAGSNEREWRLLMKPIRERAVDLAEAGRIELRRRGKRVEPDALKGIYRIAALKREPKT